MVQLRTESRVSLPNQQIPRVSPATFWLLDPVFLLRAQPTGFYRVRSP